MSYNKFVKNKIKKDPKLGEGTKFHEQVTKISVNKDQENVGLFQEILEWVKGNRYLRIIQRKGK